MAHALAEALLAGNEPAVRRLLEHTPGCSRGELPVEVAGVEGCTALHLVVRLDRADLGRLLLDDGAPINARNAEGRTALHDAIEVGAAEMQQLLLAAGAEVDICAAAILGKTERMQQLLEDDPELANDRSTGLSPLGWAAYGNQPQAARELLRRGARMDDFELLSAASVGHVEVGRVLLEQGADPDAFDPRIGGTALHAAARMKFTCNSADFVRMLLEAGADARVRSRSGKTALDVAREGAEDQARRLLLGEELVLVRDYDPIIRLLIAAN